MRLMLAALALITWSSLANAYSTRDLAAEILADRVCGYEFNQSTFTKAIKAIMAETGHPRETVTAQARQLADNIQEAVDTEMGPTKAELCVKLRSGRQLYQ